MSKYRPYLTKDETARLDAIISAQNEHRQRLRELRKPYLDLIWKGRDRARTALATPVVGVGDED